MYLETYNNEGGFLSADFVNNHDHCVFLDYDGLLYHYQLSKPAVAGAKYRDAFKLFRFMEDGGYSEFDLDRLEMNVFSKMLNYHLFNKNNVFKPGDKVLRVFFPLDAASVSNAIRVAMPKDGAEVLVSDESWYIAGDMGYGNYLIKKSDYYATIEIQGALLCHRNHVLPFIK